MLNLWLVPASLAAFREFQWEIRNRMAAFLLQEGVFTPISDELTVYVRSREPDGTLRGILVDDARQQERHATILAERGRLIEGPNGPRVLLVNGSREEIDHQTGRLNMLTFARERDRPRRRPAAARAAGCRDMSEVSLHDLLHPTPRSCRCSATCRNGSPRRISGWPRPLTAASFAMVALVSVLTGAFRRHGGFIRPLVAIFAVVGLLALGPRHRQPCGARQRADSADLAARHRCPGLICAWMLLGPRLWRERRPAMPPAA